MKTMTSTTACLLALGLACIAACTATAITVPAPSMTGSDSGASRENEAPKVNDGGKDASEACFTPLDRGSGECGSWNDPRPHDGGADASSVDAGDAGLDACMCLFSGGPDLFCDGTQCWCRIWR